MVPRRRLALLLALLVALPCLAWGNRHVVVFFLADFDQLASREGPGGGAVEFVAEGGELVAMDPADVFDQAFPGASDDGVLLVRRNPTGVDAELSAELSDPAQGKSLDISFDITRLGGAGSVGWILADDDDNPMIDITWEEDLLRVGSNGGTSEQPLESGDGDELRVLVQLREHFLGPKTFKVTVTGPGVHQTASGLLGWGGALTLGSVTTVRPAGSATGEFHMDDLKVSTKAPDSATF